MEWCLRPEVAQEIFCCLGWPSINLFASQANALLLQFFAIHCSDRQALGFDALHQPWTEVLTYAFPPPHLILQVLAKLAHSPTVLLLVTLWWTNMAFFVETMALSLRMPLVLPLPALTQQSTTELLPLQFTVWTLCMDVSMV